MAPSQRGRVALAPVRWVRSCTWPEGTYYGGVGESGMDKIAQDHLLGGRIVEELAVSNAALLECDRESRRHRSGRVQRQYLSRVRCERRLDAYRRH
jgi:hypothetical protein